METSEEEESDDEYDDPNYVPASETDTDDDEPTNRMANSKPPAAEESSMDNFMDLGDTDSVISGKSANEEAADKASDTVQSTTVAGRGQNFCFFCKRSCLKIARHSKTHVNEDADIAQALSLPAGSRIRKELLDKLRNRGNFMHNNEVLEKGSGSLKVERRAKGEDNAYEYCIHCRGMFLRTELWR